MALVAGIPAELGCAQSAPGEHHPIWTVGHLLLGDSYLLSLLGADNLPADFPTLLARYGPGATPTGSAGRYDTLEALVARLTETGTRRDAGVLGLPPDQLAKPTPDPVLARSQPTIAHHLQALVCHEGYHAGQLAAWRRAHGLQSAEWAFAPPRR